MQALYLIYDEALDAEITAIVERGMVVPRYTRIDHVIGARMAEREDETGFVADRRNRLILVVADPKTIAHMAEELRALRSRRGRGLRGFIVPVASSI